MESTSFWLQKLRFSFLYIIFCWWGLWMNCTIWVPKFFYSHLFFSLDFYYWFYFYLQIFNCFLHIIPLFHVFIDFLKDIYFFFKGFLHIFIKAILKSFSCALSILHFSGPTVAWLLGFSRDILTYYSGYFDCVFTLGLGIWIWDHFNSRCWYLFLSLLGGSSIPWFLLLSLVLRMWFAW